MDLQIAKSKSSYCIQFFKLCFVMLIIMYSRIIERDKIPLLITNILIYLILRSWCGWVFTAIWLDYNFCVRMTAMIKPYFLSKNQSIITGCICGNDTVDNDLVGERIQSPRFALIFNPIIFFLWGGRGYKCRGLVLRLFFGTPGGQN